jgi:F420-non-reducing hydrogenase iron-sulfur subunit
MNDFEPKILAFLCNWCSYVAIDAAGVLRLSPELREIAKRQPSSMGVKKITKSFS